MNEQQRGELARLKQRQEELNREIAQLSAQLAAFERQLNQPVSVPPAPTAQTVTTAPPPSPIPAPVPIPPPNLPPISLPPVISQTPVSRAETPAARVRPTLPQPALAQKQVSAPPPQSPAAPAPKKAAEPAPRESFEVRLMSFWAPRVGIVVLLTGLVFFGLLAYQKIISHLGASGKVALMYAAGAVLLGVGWWLQRTQESLKNYAQVLFAGGWVAVYFTTYAAHHVPQLLVIHNPVVDALLLLAWAGFVVWIADRKKSEVMAVMAVGLAYYTSIITRVGYFTLYSNLVLTIAAVTFLVRNRWAALSVASLLASYAAYGFWRFYNGVHWHWPEQELWQGVCFLIAYWLVFTAGVFSSRDPKFAGQNRAGFLTMNNGAFLSMFVLTMWQVRAGHFWVFALCYGTVLLLMAGLAWRLLPAEPLAKNFYLTQGLLLITVGFITKWSGLQLALILGVESVLLLMSGLERKNRVLCAGAYIAGAMSVGWAIDGMTQFEPTGLWLGIGLGALMLWNALWSSRRTVADAKILIRPLPAYFSTLAMLAWLVTTWDNTNREYFALVLAGEGLLLALSVSLLRLRELSLFGLFYVLLAQAVWTFDAFGGDFLPPWWNPCLMLALSLGLSWWWQRQKAINAGIDDDGLWQLLRKLPTVGKNVVLFAAMQVAVVLAGGWNINQGVLHYEPLFWVPAFIGVLMMLDAVAAHLQDRSPSGGWLRGQPAYSAAVAMVIWLALTWHNTRHEVFPLVIAAEGLLLTLSIYVLRVREIAVLAQGYVVLGQFAWIVNSLPGNSNPPWWNPILLMGITLALSHWWQKLRFTAPVSNASTAPTEAKATLDVLQFPSDLAQFCQLVYALAIVAILYLWLSVQMEAPAWLVVTSLLAIGLTVYGIVTRSWWLAAFGQIFLLISTGQFIWQLAQAKPNWPLPLAPVFALGALSFGTVRWFASRPDPSGRVSTPLLQLAMVYRWVSLAMSIWWVCAYVTERERIWVLASLGLLVFVLAGWRRNHEALFFSAAFTASALILFWLPLLEAPSVYVPNLLIILIILAQREIAHRFPERYSLEPAVHTTVIVVGCLSLWLFISRWVLEQEGGFYLTASWSVLALGLFGAGMFLHERVYRWVGLAVLSCALGRIVIIDVWKLETIYRVLSFLALGLVLLVLGFIYNKYQARIKEWL